MQLELLHVLIRRSYPIEQVREHDDQDPHLDQKPRGLRTILTNHFCSINVQFQFLDFI